MSRILVSTLFTFCPPGPEARMVLNVIVSSGMEKVGDMFNADFSI
jgi:hypothetical protein